MEWDIVQRLREGRTNGTHLVWSVSDIHREAADEIERLREAIRFAVEAIDGDDVISASEHLRAALGEEK